MDHYDFTNENYPIYDNFKLSSKKICQLNELIKYDTLKYSKSQVMNTKTKENEINENVRKSARANIKDKKVFDWLDTNIIEELNTKHTKNKFLLVRDELDIIKYVKNDYFAQHQDFVKFHCEYLKCATILICLYADCEGGTTKLYFPDKTIVIKETKTVGGCLLLRNEVYHSGEKLKSGTKIILKANIFITPLRIHKQKITNDDFVVIGFNKDNRIFIIPNSVIKKFKNSFVALCKTDVAVPAYEKIIVDEEYGAFEKVYEILFDPKKRPDASRETLDLLNKYGFVNDTMHLIDELMHQKKIAETQKVNDFIENNELTYLTQNAGDYESFKKILSKYDHIVPISVIFDKDKLICMNTYDGIPIYYTGLDTSEFNWFHEHEEQGICDVNFIRRTMLFTKQDVSVDGVYICSEGTDTESDSYDTSEDGDPIPKEDDEANKAKRQTKKAELAVRAIEALESYAPKNIYSENGYDYVQSIITYLATLNIIKHSDGDYENKAAKTKQIINENQTKYNIYKISKEAKDLLPVTKPKSSYQSAYVSKNAFKDTKIVRPHTSSVKIEMYHCNETDYTDVQIEVYFGFINLKFKRKTTIKK
uniref:Prolyl 4-hydroxylase alpha subunit Fe(2+) 2OG dioxygenase domain-containing protein n=1 Tax=viral metagenome TaxID=1070528 RepID=A0A6C0C787_9ZZZZ